MSEGVAGVQARLDRLATSMQQKAVSAGDEIGRALADWAKAHPPPVTAEEAETIAIEGAVSEASGGRVTVTLSAAIPEETFQKLTEDGNWAWLRQAVTANGGRIQEILKRKLGGA